MTKEKMAELLGNVNEEFVEESRELLDSQPKKRGTLRKIWVAGIAAVLVLSMTAGAAALIHWTGFAFTDKLSKRDLDNMMEQAVAVHMEAEDADGNIHRYDSNGNETEVLTAEEAQKQRLEKIEADWQKVRESTTLLDVDTMELIPNGITEVPVDSDGKFANFALGSGYMILFYPQESRTFSLKKGQSVTVQLTSTEKCSLSYDMIKDGVMLEENHPEYCHLDENGTVVEDTRPTDHFYRFTIPEDGEYSFGVEYWSSGADIFTDGVLIVE